MKKYLMTGIAVIAMCAAFTSCSHDEFTPMTQDEMAAIEAENIVKNYETAFQKVFGQPAANHTWGFGDDYSATTRGNASVNANQWADKGYTVPVELTQAQKDRVIAYFQHNKLSDGGTKDWSDFFIQQVYEGGTKPLVKRGEANPNNYSIEEYQAANGGWVKSGNQMNYLVVNNDPEHVNNFNAAHGSMNNNVQNSKGVTYITDNGNGAHSDEIQLMVDSKATAFGYHNSAADKYYYDHYTMVDGSVIDEWAEKQTPIPGAAVTGRYFVGLDFDFLQPQDCYDTNKTVKASEWKSGITYIWNADGTYTPWNGADIPFTDAQGNNIYRLKDNTNFFYAEDKITLNDSEMIKDTQDGKGGQAFNKARIDQLISQGYRPTQSNIREWIKIGSCRDYYYSDWIICIAPGKPVITTGADLRVMAEDLSAGEDAADFDFNDVVFDVYFSPKVGEAYVMVLAAGGTLPLTVHGQEVHGLFNQPINMMINTNAEKRGLSGISGLAAQRIDLTGITVNSKSDANQKIKIVVTKPVKVNGQTVQKEIELVNSNAAACKIGVDPQYTWAEERVSVNDIFRFNEWVTQGGQLEPTNP